MRLAPAGWRVSRRSRAGATRAAGCGRKLGSRASRPAGRAGAGVGLDVGEARQSVLQERNGPARALHHAHHHAPVRPEISAATHADFYFAAAHGAHAAARARFVRSGEQLLCAATRTRDPEVAGDTLARLPSGTTRATEADGGLESSGVCAAALTSGLDAPPAAGDDEGSGVADAEVVIPGVAAPETQFADIVAPVALALEQEKRVSDQIGALAAFARAHDARMRHVKAHGALYNVAANDLKTARAIARSVARYDTELILVGLANSALIDAAREVGVRAAREGFCDRAYNPDGTLRSRREPGAVHDSAERAAAQALQLARDHAVTAYDGTRINLDVDTLCLHGDTPHAVEFARAIRVALTNAGIEIKPMLS